MLGYPMTHYYLHVIIFIGQSAGNQQTLFFYNVLVGTSETIRDHHINIW